MSKHYYTPEEMEKMKYRKAFKLIETRDKYYLDYFIDKSLSYKLKVIKYGYEEHLDKLIYDENPHVRMRFAYTKDIHKYVKILSKDAYMPIRCIVASKTRHLDILKDMLNDDDLVRIELARRGIKEINISLIEKSYSGRVLGEILATSKLEYMDIISNMIKNRLFKYMSSLVRVCSNEQILYLLNKHGMELLSNSEICILLNRGKELQMKVIDYFIDDEDSAIRRIIAKIGYKPHLIKLAKDENPSVRYEVAKHTYLKSLKILIDDENDGVRDQARETLEEFNMEILFDNA